MLKSKFIVTCICCVLSFNLFCATVLAGETELLPIYVTVELNDSHCSAKSDMLWMRPTGLLRIDVTSDQQDITYVLFKEGNDSPIKEGTVNQGAPMTEFLPVDAGFYYIQISSKESSCSTTCGGTARLTWHLK